VYLAKQKLEGTISPAFANLTDLRNLYLSDNNLTGSMPQSLTSLLHLQVLDVSNNNLSGEIPKFSSMIRFNSTGNVLLQLGSLYKNITASAPLLKNTTASAPLLKNTTASAPLLKNTTASAPLLPWILGEPGDFYVYEDVKVYLISKLL
jgi:Leucine-rich repeat (LRR) protein